jgi:hypothetical protein
MTDRRWTIRPPSGESRQVRGFGGGKTARRSARAHAENHFLDAREYWTDLHPPTPPADFVRELADAAEGDANTAGQRRAAVLDRAVVQYEAAVQRVTEPPRAVLMAGIGGHRPDPSSPVLPRYCVVSDAGVFAAFRAEDPSDLLSAYRPWWSIWPRKPTVRDFVAAAKARFAHNVAHRPAPRGGRSTPDRRRR